MEVLRHLLFMFLGVLALTVLVHAQDQSGFISIDCGLQANASYKDAKTSLIYISDVPFIDTGISKSISPGFSTDSIDQQLWYVRSFPQGGWNCYNVTVTKGNKYLIRARFMYGNYDDLNKLPAFDLHLGPNKWDTVLITNSSVPVNKEAIHITMSNYIYVCLVNTQAGTPFISALEFRSLQNSSYQTQSGSLVLFERYDMGSLTNQIVRYPNDVYDRFWLPLYQFYSWTKINTSQIVDSQSHNVFWPPSNVMRTAFTPTNACEVMNFSIAIQNSALQYYFYLHFAEIIPLGANESRQFNIYLNDAKWFGPFSPVYLYTTSVYSRSAELATQYQFSLVKVGGSTQPPLLNAIEVYYVLEILQSQTEQGDVDAITNIKSTYGITNSWQGDPCVPQAYAWEGLNCSYNDTAPSRIMSLNLSTRGLTGKIAPDIANLKFLESLDLSNNNLTGPVPDFLSQLSSLKSLNLTANNLSGTIPAALYKKSQIGSLLLSVDGNPELCPLVSCKNNKRQTHIVVPVVVSVAAFFVIVAALAIIWIHKRRKQRAGSVAIQIGRTHEPLESQRRQFTYSDVLKMTNNFERIIGRGGFGTVYHGYLDDAQVAVKMLSTSSAQGYKEFQAEVNLLLRVYHKNLTTFVGYCNEGTNMGLIYEYLANGNLKQHLSESNPYNLSWEARLRIALGAAQGLEYLHNGCKPPIVHRDVKTTNILLNEKFQAKLADFGLSRTFPVESGSHVSTSIAGTPGYLDPEYYGTNWLTEKSDVYSFGVVLLEIITSRPVIATTKERMHLSQWVSSMLDNGDIKNIVDPRLQGDCDINSLWKVVELAVTCVSATSTKRPTMNQVVMELNECLASEMARTGAGHSTQSSDSIELMSLNVHTGLSPLLR